MSGKSPRLELLTVFLLAGGLAAPAGAQTAAQLLAERPKMDGVACANPSAQEAVACRVEVNPNKTVYKVVDRQGQTLRRFVSTSGNGRFNLWQYYQNGVEIYREMDTKGTGRPDQFRWVNDGGMKWGLDLSGRGRVDSWRMISSEEVAQEAFQALLARDFERIRPLFITDDEMRSLRMSKQEMDRIKAQLARAPKKFSATAATLTAGCRFRQVEAATPSCRLAETVGMDTDVIYYPNRLILYEANREGGRDTINKFLPSGEIIQVGINWRLADVPGEIIDTTPPDNTIQKQIADLDKHTYPHGTKEEINRLMTRAALIEKLLGSPECKEEQRPMWYKQLFDNLATVAPVHKPSMDRLSAFRGQLEKAMPGNDLTAYAAYREISAMFLGRMNHEKDQKKLNELQEEWMKALRKFVEVYPRAEDTPDALRYLAVGSEFSGREAQAKAWYEQIYKNFPNHPLAEMARGSVRRLESIGQPMELEGPRMTGGSYNIAQSRGKVVAVYYWASYCMNCANEFARLKELQTAWASKGFEIVCVNLDDRQPDGQTFIAQHGAVGIHLFQPGAQGGLTSPLATHYGINGLPTLFIIDKQGKVTSWRLQIRDLEDALRRLL